MKKELLFALMIVSLVFIGACDVYDTLYIKTPGQEVPEQEEFSEVDIEVIVEPSEEVLVEVTEDAEEQPIVEEIITIDKVIEENLKEEVVTIDEFIEEPKPEQVISIEDVIEKQEEIIPEDATVIIIDETELISLAPQAEDPDNDAIVFTFTSPMDANGNWQTSYGDEGEYTVTVTASDGTLTSSKEVLVIVNKKEEAPFFESFSPQEGTVELDETQETSFDIKASDLNNDNLLYTWKLDGVEVNDDNSYTYETTYDDSGSHTVKVSVSDGIFDTEKIWAVTVNNVNRPPVIELLDQIVVDETDIVVISLSASDADGDELSYSIDDNKFTQEGSTFTWETTYDDNGEYEVTVTANDGTDTAAQQVSITVENVNRAPVILDIIQK